MDATDYMPSVTSASSLLGNDTLLLGDKSRPTEMSCGEYVSYVDDLLRGITQQVSVVVKTYFYVFYKYFTSTAK